MLSTGFITGMLLVNGKIANPLSKAFWLQRYSLITLVLSHDGSDASTLALAVACALLMGSLLEENRLVGC